MVDLLIRQTVFCQMLKESICQTSPRQIFSLYNSLIMVSHNFYNIMVLYGLYNMIFL